MIKEAVATGETVEQAFEQACEILGVESHEAEFEILEMPEKKPLVCLAEVPQRYGRLLNLLLHNPRQST